MKTTILTDAQTEQISGGVLAKVAIAIAIADAAYDFYQGYKDHRR